ncbi:unnamed protein product [Owenia fusiformis]|uniref:type I protein arginine methyltransferase n=1 Tax=Owenia fusiformis TaxID=6347 RepID=A0A8S4MVY8_OWEFU|nr:unnamed protein product [Owenia fusiformis]
MASVFQNVKLSSVTENDDFTPKSDVPFKIELLDEEEGVFMTVSNGNQLVQKISVNTETECARVGKKSAVVTYAQTSFILHFAHDNDMKSFHHKMQSLCSGKKGSIFAQRTDDASAEQYFQFYGYLSQQQNMMQDYVRTSTYQNAMLKNTADFQDKVVLDVGAGSGILSFFAVQAGARKVYAIEASSMAQHCQHLVNSNKLSDRIQVIAGKVEEVELPEQVDVIISEPMGYMLFNERMLESYLHAKKWLKPGGKMFPTLGDLHVTPFTDDSLYMEQFSKANFWYQQSFHGVDLASLRQRSVQEYFKQPIVDTFDIRCCMARTQKHTVDFRTAHETDLHRIEIPLVFTMLQSGTIHGLAFWFDVAFIGSMNSVWLSTAPTQPLTHWYQVRCLLENPVFVKQGQTIQGSVILRANKRQSYDVDIEIAVPGTGTRSTNTLDLKNPFFRYTGLTPPAPAGNNQQSPSEAYWNGTDPTQTANNYQVSSILNGQSQQMASQANLIPVVNAMSVSAPINPGSIPSELASGNPSSPVYNQSSVSNQFMIGDYVIPQQNLSPNPYNKQS